MKHGIFMLGSPGSGKTYWANQNVPHKFIVINPDDINTEQFTGKIQTLYKAYLKACDILRQDVLPTGKDFIFDATASNPTNLKRLFKASCEAGYKLMLVYIDTDLEVCLTQNDSRIRRLPPKVIIKVHSQVKDSWKVIVKWPWGDIKRIKR